MKGAVIFDLDGVLVDSEGLQFRAYTQVLEHFGVQVSREEYGRHFVGRGTGPEYTVERYALTAPPERLREMKHSVYHALLRREGRLMPGVECALDRLAGNFQFAVATNSCRRDVEFVMQRFGIGRFFGAIVTRECYEKAKPAPDAFLAAAAALDVAADRCVVVEDTERGVAAAHAAGAKVVAVPHELSRDNDFGLADRVLDNIDELTVDLVHELLAASPRREERSANR